MKITELVNELQARLKKHGDIEVSITWEGQVEQINNDNIYLSKTGALYIDADDNRYKKQFAAGLEAISDCPRCNRKPAVIDHPNGRISCQCGLELKMLAADRDKLIGHWNNRIGFDMKPIENN